MVKTVSAAQANRAFSKLMKLVESGEEVIVTSRGTPKMKLVRIEEVDDAVALRQKAFDELTAWFKSQPIRNLPRLTRDDFYD